MIARPSRELSLHILRRSSWYAGQKAAKALQSDWLVFQTDWNSMAWWLSILIDWVNKDVVLKISAISMMKRTHTMLNTIDKWDNKQWYKYNVIINRVFNKKYDNLFVWNNINYYFTLLRPRVDFVRGDQYVWYVRRK